MNKQQIEQYLNTEFAFRDYSFKPESKWGKVGVARSINLLNPGISDLTNAIETFNKDGFETIVIYLSKEKMKSKRIKQVFSSSAQVFHLWAAQTQEHARQAGTGGGFHSGRGQFTSMAFFEGKSCYSYGHHYELGRLTTINGIEVALINDSGYSNTTAKHISKASRAVSHLPIVYVDSSFDWQSGLIKEQGELIENLFKKLSQRKFWFNTAFDKYDKQMFNSFNNKCKLLGMPELVLNPDNDTIAVIDSHVKKQFKREAELKKEIYRKRECELALQKEMDVEDLNNWLNGGEYTSGVYRAQPQLIRVKGTEVQTTSNASVPLKAAMIALKSVIKGKLKKGAMIGDYKFDSKKGDVVTIGCHKISLKQAMSVLMPKKVGV